MSRRVVDIASWRRRKPRPVTAPGKGRLYASGDELLVARLRELALPPPPPKLRERSRERWAGSYGARNHWRD
jgi:hypothetical protein